jgi:hypothetical protein
MEENPQENIFWNKDLKVARKMSQFWKISSENF